MDLLKINKIQSYTDIITNSSSEIFMLHTDNTVEQVEEALSKFTTGYYKPVLFKVEEYRKHKEDYIKEYHRIRKLFEDKDGHIQNYDEFWKAVDNFHINRPELIIYHTITGWFIDADNPEEVFEIKKDYLLTHSWKKSVNPLQLEFANFIISNNINPIGLDRIYQDEISDELWNEFINSHKFPSIREMLEETEYCGRIGDVNDLDGCIILLSEEDNSIPHKDFETIENMFNANRYHLG